MLVIREKQNYVIQKDACYLAIIAIASTHIAKRYFYLAFVGSTLVQLLSGA
jgi:hypothetical protein